MTFKRANDGCDPGANQSSGASGDLHGPTGAERRGRLGKAKALGRVACSL